MTDAASNMSPRVRRVSGPAGYGIWVLDLDTGAGVPADDNIEYRDKTKRESIDVDGEIWTLNPRAPRATRTSAAKPRTTTPKAQTNKRSTVIMPENVKTFRATSWIERHPRWTILGIFGGLAFVVKLAIDFLEWLFGNHSWIGHFSVTGVVISLLVIAVGVLGYLLLKQNGGAPRRPKSKWYRW